MDIVVGIVVRIEIRRRCLVWPIRRLGSDITKIGVPRIVVVRLDVGLVGLITGRFLT